MSAPSTPPTDAEIRALIAAVEAIDAEEPYQLGLRLSGERKFAALAREKVPALAREVLALREEVARVKAERDAYCRQVIHFEDMWGDEKDRADAAIARAEKAEAEAAGLRALLLRCREYHLLNAPFLAQIDAALRSPAHEAGAPNAANAGSEEGVRG